MADPAAIGEWIVDTLKAGWPVFTALAASPALVQHLRNQDTERARRADETRRREERRAAKRERRREQIATWRKMVKGVHNSSGGGKRPVGEEIQRHVDYMSLRRHLITSVMYEIEGEGRTAKAGSGLGAQLDKVVEEIDRIEGEWGLRN